MECCCLWIERCKGCHKSRVALSLKKRLLQFVWDWVPRLWVSRRGRRQVPGGPWLHLAWHLLCMRCKWIHFCKATLFLAFLLLCRYWLKVIWDLVCCGTFSSWNHLCVCGVFLQVCCTSLEGGTFFSKKDKPLCKKHAHTLKIWILTFPYSF